MKVILVGAGPGHPELLTLRGKRAIEEAEVVVYDRLVSPEILAMIHPHAECINVGKESSNHLMAQEEINALLLRKAQEGKIVVRLKGGDPFLFGRGGEELQVLQEHNIPFEVVSGIPSAIGAVAFAGIPVTHRELCSSVHIVTGHAQAGKPLEIDFQALVRTRGTLVFLMGVSSLPELMEGLLQNGIAPTMPTSIVERGSTPQQRRVDGTVETMAQLAKEHKIISPAIIVVGKVCALAEDFCWYDRLPLRGKTIVVTRSADKQSVMSEALRAQGAKVVEFPCIKTEAIFPNEPLSQAIKHMKDYSTLCFTSPVGVECFWIALEALGLDARYLANQKIAVVGSATAKELAKHGIRADWMPEIFDVAHLGALLTEKAQGKILILRAKEGAKELTDVLHPNHYDDIGVYQTSYHVPASVKIEGEFYASFTSASTVKAFVSAMGEGFDCSLAFCIGKQTAKEAEKHGMTVKIAKQASISSLVDCICQEVGQ